MQTNNIDKHIASKLKDRELKHLYSLYKNMYEKQKRINVNFLLESSMNLYIFF